jgi:hypothetical protein
VPQPSGGGLLARRESASLAPLDGSEPRMFPGVVSRRRRSMVQRDFAGGSGESAVEEAEEGEDGG